MTIVVTCAAAAAAVGCPIVLLVGCGFLLSAFQFTQVARIVTGLF